MRRFSAGFIDSLIPHVYPLRTLEVIFAIFKWYFFSKIYMSEAYLQIPVDEECQFFFTITTHQGIYKFKSLPFNLNAAQLFSQQTMDRMLTWLDVVVAYINDIVIKEKNDSKTDSGRIPVSTWLRFQKQWTKMSFFLERLNI